MNARPWIALVLLAAALGCSRPNTAPANDATKPDTEAAATPANQRA